MARFSLKPLLSAALAIALLAANVVPAASADDAFALDSVRAAYHDLFDLFYRPLDARDLLQAGWSALAADAPRRGAQAPGPLPDLPVDPDAAFDLFAGAYANYVSSLPPSVSPSTAAAAIENGMADSVHEQHTHYLPPQIMQRFLSTVSGGQQSIGLGVRLSNEPPGLITDVAPNGPAANAGVQPGDVIVRAAGRDLSNADTLAIAQALVGPAASTVEVTVDRQDSRQTFEITRGPYYFPPLESNLLPSGVGYLRLSDFVISGTRLPNGTELLADLDRRLDDLDAQGAQGLVLDLRDNGGGSIQTADEILGRFLPDSVRSVREFDERGHETFELAAGRTHARQLPMAVLVNGGSASASEVVAAALRDAHRAVLVGQRTAGAVASSELLPLPGGAGMQVAVAAATAADSGTELDGVGVTPDIAAAQSRTLSDYRTGHDPQLDTAVTALASAPPPPSAFPVTPPIAPSDLDLLLESALPASGELPTNDRLKTASLWQRLDYVHPNELIDQNGGAADPVLLQKAMRARGYEGSVVATYGSTPGDLPAVTVNVDLYASAAGAHDAVSTNDLPELQQPMNVLATLGDEGAGYRGTWLAAGSTVETWRRGRVVVTVAYSDVPGFERPDTVAAIAQLVDSRAQGLPIP